MGTSSSYKGPKNKSPLLPPWAPPILPDDEPNPPLPPEPEPEPDQDQNPEQRPEEAPEQTPTPPPVRDVTNNWGGAKGYLSKFASGSQGYNIKKGAKAYMKATGGARKASKAARVGKTSTAQLGTFLRSVSENGFNETLRRYGLTELIGQPADKVIASIVDIIAPSGASNEDANARAAVLDALENLFIQFELEGDDLSRLESLGEQDIRTAILDCCKAYIYEKWLQQLSIAIERRAITPNEALAKEQEAKNFIKESVNYDFENKSLLQMDFTHGEGKILINDIFSEAYLILEQ